MKYFNSATKEKDDDKTDEEKTIEDNYWRSVSLVDKSDKKSGSKKTKVKTKTSKTWELEDPMIEKCPTCEDKLDVLISRNTRHKIQAMMDVMEKDEWLGLLIGEKQDEQWYISDLMIPKQEVSSVKATKKSDCDEPDDVLGIIHSHHDMGTFWSGTDEKHANSNFDLSIVVDSNMKTLGTARIKTECGKLMRVDTNIDYEEDYMDKYEWANEQKDENIEKKYTYTSGYSGYGLYGGYRYGKTVKKPKKEKDDKEVVAIINEKKDRLDNEERNILDLTEFYLGKQELEKLATSTDGIPLIGNPNDKKSLDFDDWLSIYYMYEFKNWNTVFNTTKRRIMKQYLNELAENSNQIILDDKIKLEDIEIDDEIDDNDAFIPNVQRSDGKLFADWLKENRNEAYKNFDELTDEQVQELLEDFEFFVEYYDFDEEDENDESKN